MNTTSNSSGGGLGLASVLGIIFIVLKLCGVIIWSWIWVLSPWWISFLLLFVVAITLKCLSSSGWR